MNKQLTASSICDILKEAKITNATTILQDADQCSVVFYGLREGAEFRQLFEKRIEGKKIGLLVLCGIGFELEEDLKKENYWVEESELYPCQKSVMDQLYPQKKEPRLVGITGTNGKTTTANLAMQISNLLGHSCIAVGTIGVCGASGKIGEVVGNTTPSYIELRKIVAEHSDCQAIIFEFSSHALDQNRHHDLKIELAGWTSFSQDHLDYHDTLEEYFSAKEKIVEKLVDKKRLYIPASQMELREKLKGKASAAKTLKEQGYAELPLFFQPDFNQENLELALELNRQLWGEFEKIDLSKLSAPKGRFDPLLWGTKMVVVDYAHTPDALENISNAISAAFPEKKLVTLFGCGGDRDKSKRPLMAKAAALHSDKIMITSDNPRSENPDKIIDDIIVGFKGEFERETDRKKAIVLALKGLPENSILLIAGKGHEEYQEVNGVKKEFSDFDCVKKVIDND
ncbi:MAG: UDP-N-acetylmuramoyl-L-alanyl-D-glutamate--2,6-diaminopimelate ligase [Halobacteriovoraceae bacterium]|jgi:UDP-N-acetylmuramoyl-L-alanyl-D-glutamate--2,6-diaminopimelate ligase|nr:UDP-N-acetylmuramoyl-L-alanyl-D-glutamate--2,6-diaminopimelate ligase [Halobacteriovoraceae bacterium]